MKTKPTKPIRYQKRDMDILATLGQVVIAARPTIQQYLFPKDNTGRACLRRLRLLCTHGLIAKISFPTISFNDTPGQLITFYRLTRTGAEMLAEVTGVRPKRLLRTQPRPQTLLHRHDLCRTVLAVNQATKLVNLPEPEWIFEQDPQRPGVSRKAPRAERFFLYEDFKQADGKDLQLRPDASSWHRFPDPKKGDRHWHDLLIWWEIDRGTEGLPQICAKLPPYSHFLHQDEHDAAGVTRKLYRRHWPTVEQATLRVFFVCPSKQRIDTIREAIREQPGAEFVRLATLDSLKGKETLREPIWYDVKGNCKAIYPDTKPSTS